MIKTIFAKHPKGAHMLFMMGGICAEQVFEQKFVVNLTRSHEMSARD